MLPFRVRASITVLLWLQFWADRMRNPQILGVLLPRGTFRILPGANADDPGTGSTATSGVYHLTLDCIGRQLPFLLDFQGSELVLVVRRPCSLTAYNFASAYIFNAAWTLAAQI